LIARKPKENHEKFHKMFRTSAAFLNPDLKSNTRFMSMITEEHMTLFPSGNPGNTTLVPQARS
jgi:hypothetical protein